MGWFSRFFEFGSSNLVLAAPAARLTAGGQLSSTVTVRVAGLDLMDFLELQEQCPDGSPQRLPEQRAENGLYGEPATITALLVLASVGVQTFSNWLAQRRAQSTNQPGFTVEVRSDGTVCIRLDPHSPMPIAPVDTSAAEERVDQIVQVIERLFLQGG